MISIILTAICLSATAAFAQLTDEDIVALREKGKQEGWTFTVGENPATKYSLEILCGAVLPPDWRDGARFDPCTPTKDLPDRFDWRDYDACTPVKSQGGCGSCWAFGTVGTVESYIKMVDGLTIDLSEQWLVSCNSRGWDCEYGGWFAYDYFEWDTDPCDSTGPVVEADFPYMASDVPCGCPYPHRFHIESWSYIGSGSPFPPVEVLKQAIMDYGPIAVTVYANSAMQGYNGGIFNGCVDEELNHLVDLVGWDDNQGTEGVWFMRNSWGKSWGEDGGYMRIPYGCSRIGEYAAYAVYAGAQELVFTYQGAVPETLIPDEPTPFEVMVEGIYNGTPVPGTGQLHYSINAGEVQIVSMTETAPNHYEGAMPAVGCGDVLQFYVSAEENSKGRLSDTDPSASHKAIPASAVITVFEDDFETDKGWTVSGNAVDGRWERGVPVGGGDRGDPPTDYDGSGNCYLTDNVDGNSDVEYGATRLVSPTIDGSGLEPRVHYARWYCNDLGDIKNANVMEVYVSNNDGGSWTPVETVGPTEQSSGGWYEHSFWVSDFLTPTSQLKLRFDAASEEGDAEIVEAGLDDVLVTVYECSSYICGDANGDESINLGDAVYLVNHVFHEGPAPDPAAAGDVNCDGGVNLGDGVYMVNFIFVAGAPEPCADCP